MPALAKMYRSSPLHDAGLDPEVGDDLLDDYLADFAAMHLDWTPLIDRDVQTSVMKRMLQCCKSGKLGSILEVHQLFWNEERHVAYCVKLLNAAPGAVPEAEKLMATSDMALLDLDLMLLVHRTLAEELRDAGTHKLGEHGPHRFYREWLSRKMVVAGLMKELLSDQGAHHGVDHQDRLRTIRSDAEPRVETLALFLEYVAVPLHLPLGVVVQLASELPAGNIRQTKTLGAILRMASGIADQDGALTYIGAFLESWTLDVCVRDAEAIADLEPECLRLICNMAAGLPVALHRTLGVSSASVSEWSEIQERGIASLGTKGKDVPRSESLNLALLRKLIAIAEDESKEMAAARARIEELLSEVRRHSCHNDTIFATRYSVLCEEAAAERLSKLSRPAEWPDLALGTILSQEATQAPAQLLRDVGTARWLLAQYAAILCQEPIDLQLHAEALAKVDPLLQTSDARLELACRSLRLYLLKCIERQRGISFLRGLLAETPLNEANWVERWREMHDIDFEKFIGAALVPKWNPFLGDDFMPEYKEAKSAVFDMMNSTATDKLDKFAAECQGCAPQQKRRYVAGLMLVLTQEPGLLAALEEEGRKPAWRGKLNEWLKTTTALPITDQERMLLRIFAGDASPILEVPQEHRAHLMPFVISGGRRMDDLLRWRLLGHLAAVLLCAPPATVLASLRKVMLDPSDLMNGDNTYLPGMDEDIRNRVLKALLERGENIWKFKTHWYKCTCGYTFFIGECGRPMEVTACPGCSLTIGGKDHNKTTSTTEDDEKDRSPQGYMLPRAEKDEKHISFRELPSGSARAVRLLLHGAMLCGLAARADNPMPRIFDHLVNRESMCTMHQEAEAKYIGDHFSNDWKFMVEILSSNNEDLAASLHSLLRKMGAELKDEPKAAALSSDGSFSWEKLNLETRNKWEETIEAKYLSKMVKDFDSQLQGLYQRWGGAEEDGKFVAELKETADVRDFPKDKRQAEMPQLWAYRTPVTLDVLHSRLGVTAGAQETLPVLTTVLQQPLFSVMPALGLLVGVFEWHSLVLNRFSGRITRTEAGELRVGQVLDSITHPTERERWEFAYSQFEKAWHVAWPHIERHECLEIPAHFKSILVNRDSPMLFCIAHPENEGICPLALTQWLAERHNELVQVVSAALVRPSRADRANPRQQGSILRYSQPVSSRLIGQHDVINYDSHSLMHFVKTRCVTYGIGGRLNFDFKQLEQQLRRELARPEITMELRGFQWLGEYFAQSSELKAVIKQKDLLPDIIDRIKAEVLSPSVANRCLQKVQMASSFIQKLGGFAGETAGETLLCEYLSTFLQDSPESIPSKTARSEVCLWHLSSFEKVLKQIMNQDPMDSVDPKYRKDLPDDLRGQVLAAKPGLPAALADIMAGIAEAYLKDTFMGEDASILPTLQAWPDFSGEDLAATQDHLPRGLAMKHWVAVYRLLKAKPAR